MGLISSSIPENFVALRLWYFFVLGYSHLWFMGISKLDIFVTVIVHSCAVLLDSCYSEGCILFIFLKERNIYSMVEGWMQLPIKMVCSLPTCGPCWFHMSCGTVAPPPPRTDISWESRGKANCSNGLFVCGARNRWGRMGKLDPPAASQRTLPNCLEILLRHSPFSCHKTALTPFLLPHHLSFSLSLQPVPGASAVILGFPRTPRRLHGLHPSSASWCSTPPLVDVCAKWDRTRKSKSWISTANAPETALRDVSLCFIHLVKYRRCHTIPVTM